MSIDRVRAYLRHFGVDERIHEFDVSSATVELAAEAIGTEPARICKTISFKMPDGCALIQAAGDTKIDNRKFKDFFGIKAKMLTAEEVIEYTGYTIGGVCAFDIDRSDVHIYADTSLKRFDIIYPACGSANSMIPLSCDELFDFTRTKEWIDVCKRY